MAILSLPKFLVMVGRDLANLSLISTSKKSDRYAMKRNSYQRNSCISK